MVIRLSQLTATFCLFTLDIVLGYAPGSIIWCSRGVLGATKLPLLLMSQYPLLVSHSPSTHGTVRYPTRGGVCVCVRLPAVCGGVAWRGVERRGVAPRSRTPYAGRVRRWTGGTKGQKWKGGRQK